MKPAREQTGLHMAEEQETKEKKAVPIQDIYSPQEAATLLGIKVNRIWKMARETDDPFPLRRLKGMRRGSVVFRDELLEWAHRNFDMVADRYR